MVSIIILSYNTKDLLRSCLQSVFTYTRGVDFEVIVVDNASHDESVGMIKKEFKNVRVVENEKNVGFSKGNNIGARSAKGEQLLFLNSDIIFTENDVKHMVSYIEKDKKNGVVGAYFRNPDGSHQKSYGSFYTLPRLFLDLFFGERLGFPHNIERPQETDWVSGGCFLIRKDLFEGLGGFDENFFMYVEDMEFCFRIKKKGYRILVVPSSFIHAGQGSSDRSFAIIQIYKSMLYFFKKHNNSLEYAIVKLMLLAKAVTAIWFGTLTGNSYLTNTYKKAIQF